MTATRRILITGGAGCLGSNLVDRFLSKRDQICVIDNYATSNRAVLPESSEQLQIIEGTIADAKLCETALSEFKPTHIIHAAAAYKNPDDWIEDAATNVYGTVNIIKAAEKVGGIKRIVNLQTALCYGRPDQVPIPVDAHLRPVTSYAISKTAGEQYALMSSVPAVSLRLANITGPRLSIGPIPTFYARLKEGKSCFCSDSIRDFMDMDDFFSALDKVLENEAPVGVFNISTGEGKSIKDVFDLVANHLEVEDRDVPIVPIGADDVPAVVLDPTETQKQLGWTAKVDFEKTIKKMLSWYDEHGVSNIYSHLAAPKK